jgi:hypothetical protein
MLASSNFVEETAGASVLAEFSPFRIGLFLSLFLLFFIGFMVVPSWHISGTISRLDQHPVFTYFEMAFCGFGILMFGVLLWRAMFVSKIAVYVRDRQLFWILPFGVSSIKLSEAFSLSKWILPGMIVISGPNGKRNYIASSITGLSSSELISRISKAR